MISVIMPAYNSEKYISEAIESVISQSCTNWELIIVDDGSTDQTSEIIDEYAAKDSRIKAFHRENSGVSAARNFALEIVCGDYITFIDSDDVYNSERLARMLAVFEQNPQCDAVFAEHKEFRNSLEADEATDFGEAVIIDEDILKNVISDTRKHFVWNAMLKSEIAKKVRFAPIRFAEDFCYFRDCACNFKQIAALDEVLYYYRRDNENAMTSHFFTEKYVPDYMKLLMNIYEFCKVHGLEDAFYRKTVAREYAQCCMRIRKSTSYKKLVECMNDEKFREGLKFADASECALFDKILFFLLKHKIYIAFALWIW